MAILKRIGGFAFILAFVFALNIFAGIGRNIIPLGTARFLFIGLGGLGLILNLVTFQTGKHHPIFNLVYWIGSILTFLGLIALFMNWPYARYILIGGMITIGVSFFLPKKWAEPKESSSDLLDD